MARFDAAMTPLGGAGEAPARQLPSYIIVNGKCLQVQAEEDHRLTVVCRGAQAGS